jgi:hypothetical protein
MVVKSVGAVEAKDRGMPLPLELHTVVHPFKIHPIHQATKANVPAFKDGDGAPKDSRGFSLV